MREKAGLIGRRTAELLAKEKAMVWAVPLGGPKLNPSIA